MHFSEVEPGNRLLMAFSVRLGEAYVQVSQSILMGKWEAIHDMKGYAELLFQSLGKNF